MNYDYNLLKIISFFWIILIFSRLCLFGFAVQKQARAALRVVPDGATEGRFPEFFLPTYRGRALERQYECLAGAQILPHRRVGVVANEHFGFRKV